MNDKTRGIPPVSPVIAIGESPMFQQRNPQQNGYGSQGQQIQYQSTEEKIAVTTLSEGLSSAEAQAIVKEAKEKGWTSINVSGDLSMRRAIWFAAQGKGMEVKGYSPTLSDRKEISLDSKLRLSRKPSQSPRLMLRIK